MPSAVTNLCERSIGGGQGVVYLAHQRTTRRDVAIKVLREGPFAGPADRARFEREVQILASVKHPNIVAIHDSGSAAGSFYFVMDYIPGSPLDEWADSLRSRSDDRAKSRVSSDGMRTRHARLLSAFIKICDALNVAHQRGVIHRDLKPTNIRVAEDDEPFVLDFGLAKQASTEPGAIDETMLTVAGQFLGTLPWASPEQVEGTSYHADIRSDVYALGLMQYRALTGRMPYSPGANVAEMIRVITEVEPSRPRSLVKDVDGDLETIVLKCLNKDPERRYQTAGEVAEDLRRYLQCEPIGARRESGWYMLRMFARRHRVAVGVTGAFAALLVCASALLVYLYSQAKHNERLAIRRADEIKQVAEFQASQLSGVDTTLMGVRIRQDLIKRAREAGLATGHDESIVDQQIATLEEGLAGVNFTDLALRTLDENIFERALRAIDVQFKEQPLVQAGLLQTVADTLKTLGLFERAMGPQTEALAICRRVLGNEHRHTLVSINNMGRLLHSMGRTDEAMSHHREALDTRRRVLGAEHAETLTSMNDIGNVFQSMERLNEAMRYHREVLDARRRILGNEHLETLTSINNMGGLHYQMGQLDQAMSYYQEALTSFRRVLGDEQAETLTAINNMGHVLRSIGPPDEARPYFREALETRRRVLGDEHPNTLNSIDNMAALHEVMGRMDEAMALRREALSGYRRVLGDDHPHTLRSINGMGHLLRSMGRFHEAMPYVREALESHRRVLGNEHTETVIAIGNMSNLLRSMGRTDEAIPYAREALDTNRRVLGNEHSNTLTAIMDVGILLKSRGQLEEAEPYYQEALDTCRRVLGDEHAKTLSAILNMGGLLWSTARFDEAMPYYREALDGFQRVLGDEHPNTLSAIMSIGSLLKSMGRSDEAMRHYREGLSGYRRALGDEHPFTLRSINLMGELLISLGQLDKAMPYIRESLDTCRRVLGEEHPETLRSINNMGNLLHSLGRSDEAEPLLLEAAAGIEKLPPKHSLRAAAAENLVKLYEARQAAEPQGGHEAKVAKWRAELELLKRLPAPEEPSAGRRSTPP